MVIIANQRIVLYSTGCPKCGVLERKLNEAGITYSTSADVKKMEELGIKFVPVLSVDGKLLEFGEAVKWINNNT